MVPPLAGIDLLSTITNIKKRPPRLISNRTTL
jgi:hypothetical protein